MVSLFISDTQKCYSSMHHIHSLLSIGNIEEEIRILDLRFKYIPESTIIRAGGRLAKAEGRPLLVKFGHSVAGRGQDRTGLTERSEVRYG